MTNLLVFQEQDVHVISLCLFNLRVNAAAFDSGSASDMSPDPTFYGQASQNVSLKRGGVHLKGDLEGEAERGGGGGGDTVREEGAGWGDEGGRRRRRKTGQKKERERGGRACQPRPRLHALFSTTT